MELELSRFSLHYLFSDSLVLFREKAYKHNLKMTSEIEDGLESILADERKIRQVLFNLLGNATKFTPDGGSIRLFAGLTEDKKQVKISVKDTGIGIAPENQKFLFQPFKQLDSSYAKKYEGTGLGLLLCKKIVELHGGGIGMESEEGKGSTFFFTIPASDASQTSG